MFWVPGNPVGVVFAGSRYCTVLVTVLNVFNGMPAIVLVLYSIASIYGVIMANSDFSKVLPLNVPVFWLICSSGPILKLPR